MRGLSASADTPCVSAYAAHTASGMSLCTRPLCGLRTYSSRHRIVFVQLINKMWHGKSYLGGSLRIDKEGCASFR